MALRVEPSRSEAVDGRPRPSTVQPAATNTAPAATIMASRYPWANDCTAGARYAASRALVTAPICAPATCCAGHNGDVEQDHGLRDAHGQQREPSTRHRRHRRPSLRQPTHHSASGMTSDRVGLPWRQPLTPGGSQAKRTGSVCHREMDACSPGVNGDSSRSDGVREGRVGFSRHSACAPRRRPRPRRFLDRSVELPWRGTEGGEPVVRGSEVRPLDHPSAGQPSRRARCSRLHEVGAVDPG